MQLWKEWLHCVRQLRPACRRSATFLWLVLARAAISTRPDQAGVTSFVRGLGLLPAASHRLLHLFHSPAVRLEQLTLLWAQLVVRFFSPLRVGELLVCLADGIKAPKEGRKMPAVKSLHQAPSSNSEAPFILGHSLQAASLLVCGPAGAVVAIPLLARIHEGLVWCNARRKTLLDKLVAMVLPLSGAWQRKLILVADAYYASRKVVTPLLADGHHLVARLRVDTVAYQPAPRPEWRRRGRPRLCGAKLRLRDLATQSEAFTTVPSPLPGDAGVAIHYRCLDLLGRPAGRRVRFVLVDHPLRGKLFLMTTHLELDPLEVLVLYHHRFEIEGGFRQAIHVLGSYAYHFWMMAMTPIHRRDGDQHLHHKSADYRRQVLRKLGAYHLHVQLGCIAQGLLLHLALNHRALVWTSFRSWLRTIDPGQPPSERMVSYALRAGLGESLDGSLEFTELQRLLDRYAD
jgi:hypothetical protein